jgi:hypothetical protein
MDVPQALLAMRDLGQVTELARHAPVQIPDQSFGTESLVADYQQSKLFDFHSHFYAEEHDLACVTPGSDPSPTNASRR